MQLFTVSGSPHVHNNQSVHKIMWGVVIALVPAFLVSLWYFGLGALITTAIAVFTCVAVEFVIAKYMLKEHPSIRDGSAVITGILLAFNVPSSIPWWQLVIGSIVAIGVAKMSFGGLGRNPFNPALVGRVFMLISFPVDMTLWPLPIQNRFLLTDAVTGPTSLGIVKEGVKNGESIAKIASEIPDYANMLLGNMGGSLGEVSAAALILGGLYMIFRKIITWHIPLSYLFTVFAFTGALWLINPEMYIDPVFHLIAGGLMLGAIFMATDMTTSPMTWKGMLVYGFGCGVLTVLIRVWGAYPEGVSFAILIMNAATPLINKGFKPSRFGEVTKA
jgi:electron transport complex protein RnfD